MRKRFVITGAPGSGKTPILRELVRFGFIGVNEPAREILAEQRAIGGNGVHDKDPQLFCDLMLERAMPTTSGWGAQVSQPSSIGASPTWSATPKSSHSTLPRPWLPRDATDTTVVFVLPAWPEIYVTDGDRQMTFESAQAFGERVREVYLNLGYTIVDVPRDSVETRTRFIAEHVGHA